MKRTGVAELPLHSGSCPPWLFSHMKRLSAAIVEVIVHEYGRLEFIRRISDPFFFQALGCTLGFDWHSSGLTTTVCAALKEAVKPEDLGVTVCGGKGRASRQAQNEIQEVADVFSLSTHKVESLRYASRMAAKVDNSCIQDGYQLYHHCFVLSENGDWAVIQQGMHGRMARRYHWLSDGIRSFVEEPHSGIVSDRRSERVLDMTASDSGEAREESVDVVCHNLQQLRHCIQGDKQLLIDEYLAGRPMPRTLVMPTQHHIPLLNERTMLSLTKAHELQPRNYEELVAVRGVGSNAIRALALVSELVYGKPPSWKDPAKYSFAHGGKDGIPYPVDRKTYRNTIRTINDALQAAKIGQREKLRALSRLHEFL